jgi:hypothetical protein
MWDNGGGWGLLVCFALGLEAYAWVANKRTLSQQTWAWLRRRPLGTAFVGGLGAGLLLGHLFL